LEDSPRRLVTSSSSDLLDANVIHVPHTTASMKTACNSAPVNLEIDSDDEPHSDYNDNNNTCIDIVNGEVKHTHGILIEPFERKESN